MGINGSFISGEGLYGGLRLQVNYTVTYNTSQGKYILYVTPFLIYPYAISKSASSGAVSYITNAGGSGSGAYTSVAVSSNSGGVTQLCSGYNISITPTLHSDGTFVIKPSATFVFNGTYNGVYVGTMTAEGSDINLTPPSITGISFTNIGATTATMTATANFNCDKWEYKVGGGAWTVYGLTNGTSATASLSALTAGTANTVQVRATRTDIGRTGSATTASVTTLGKATINSISRVQLDVEAPSVDIDCTIYNTSYTYELTVYYDETVFILDMPLTFASKGRQTKTIDLTASKSDILGEMPAVASLMITYALNTTIGGSIYQDTADGEVYVTEENSAPVWAATPSITAFDEATQEFFGGNTDIHNGVINNVTEYRGYCAGGAITRNGAIAIDRYYIVVGGNTITANVAQITSEAVGFAGNTTTIAFGAVDSRGFKVEYSVTDIPIWQYTPMYWQQTDIARRNGYDNEIDFTIRAKYDPLEATVGGTTYDNVPSVQITMRYSTDNGTTWNTTTLVGTNNTTDDTIDYTGTPLNITNTANVLIELTASDLLSTAPLTLTVPNGVPLISFADGKITINGDVEINGNLVVNGTITQNTPTGDYTMTISGNGDTSYCYVVDLNGESPVQYYTNGQTFTVENGNSILCCVSNMQKRVTIDGVAQTLDQHGNFNFTPTSNCTITMTFAIADKSWIDITTN